MRRLPDVLWVVLWGLLSTGWILSASPELSATFDEPFYLRSSLKSWRTGSNFELMKAGTMPLPVDVEYLPVYLWEQVRGQPFDEEKEFHRLLQIGRTGNLVFWWVLLVYGFRVANLYGGAWAGRLGVVLLATEPSLLGHACLATTDIAITAAMLLFTFHYQTGRTRGWFRRWFLPGVLYGVAMTAKASALTFVPIVMFALEIPRWRVNRIWSPPVGVGRIPHVWNQVRPLWADFWKMLLVATVVLWGYCGCDWVVLPSGVKWAENLQDETWGPPMRWLTRNAKIFPNAGQGVVYQIKHNIRGHGAYLLGEWYPRAVRHYFPVALSIKLTLPVLGLFLLLLAQPRSLATPLTLIVLGLFLFAFNIRVQIGIRLIFPFVVFFLLMLGVGFARTSEKWKSGLRWSVLLLFSGLAAVPPLQVWPDGLRYANELWGGPDRVHLYLSDSNSDWGQGVTELDRWTEERGLPLCRVWYYGMDPKIADDPNRLLPLHHNGIYPAEKPEDFAKYVRGHIVAVGKSILLGDPLITPSMPTALEFIRKQQPMAETRSFVIYDFRAP
ncbi:ArnT family glycosyltransferase [Zavarzinella formosa]|uniref:ArnT family glycosyltransferase n=1 Tax=Zavarzinella formosa TaxID=360055 RepID=UPI000314C5BB|nr:hypothetical protein [Zavarzinella formosa]